MSKKMSRHTLSRLLCGSLLLIFGFYLVHGQTVKMLKKPGCNQTEMIKIDKMVARLLPFGPNGRPMPEKEAHLKRFCPESRNLTHAAERFFKRCFSGDVLQTSKLALYPAKKSAQQFCSKSGNARKSKRLEKIMKVSPCINKHFKKNNTCLKLFIGDLKTITQKVEDSKQKIPQMCCSSVKALHCIERELEKKQCSRENKELIIDFMAASSGDFFNIACGEYNESTDRCNSLKPLPNATLSTSRPNKQARKSAPQMTYHTPLFLVMDLLSNLGDSAK